MTKKIVKKVMLAMLMCFIFVITLFQTVGCSNDESNDTPTDTVIDVSVDDCRIDDYITYETDIDCEPVKKEVWNGLYRYTSTGKITYKFSQKRDLNVEFENVMVKVRVNMFYSSRDWEFADNYEEAAGSASVIYVVKSFNLSSNGEATVNVNLKLSFVESMMYSVNVQDPSPYFGSLEATSGRIVIHH